MCAGYIRAYDASTGAIAWTTHTVPAPGEPGADTWPGDTWKTGGGATWQSGAYDPQLNLLYWGTGNPGPWNSDLRKGDNKWTCSLLALDPDTGAIKWGYQYTPNDGWDYDGNNAPILADIKLSRQERQGRAADQSQRVFLRARPHQRQVLVRRPYGGGDQLDQRARSRHRPAQRE